MYAYIQICTRLKKKTSIDKYLDLCGIYKWHTFKKKKKNGENQSIWTQFCLLVASYKLRDFGKQCRPRSTAEKYAQGLCNQEFQYMNNDILDTPETICRNGKDRSVHMAWMVYHKIPKNSDTRKIAVIILQFEQFASTIELWVKKMQAEWQTV